MSGISTNDISPNDLAPGDAAHVYYKMSACGLKITQRNNFLQSVDFVTRVGSLTTRDVVLLETVKQLNQYQNASAFTFDLPLNPQGTEFQRKVWAILQKIPAGEVRTYGDIARELASSARAVGNACRANPIPLIIPCHRVVSAQGIGGFAGQTAGEKISLKKQLLLHEGLKMSLLTQSVS